MTERLTTGATDGTVGQKYRVREFAHLAGVTVKALRHYDRLGLLTPARTSAGHRAYSTRDRERLRQILALKRRFADYRINEIATFLGKMSFAIVNRRGRSWPPAGFTPGVSA